MVLFAQLNQSSSYNITESVLITKDASILGAFHINANLVKLVFLALDWAESHISHLVHSPFVWSYVHKQFKKKPVQIKIFREFCKTMKENTWIIGQQMAKRTKIQIWSDNKNLIDKYSLIWSTLLESEWLVPDSASSLSLTQAQ